MMGSYELKMDDNTVESNAWAGWEKSSVGREVNERDQVKNAAIES
jgi:hypothetical protein